MLVVQSLEKSNKLELLLFTIALGRQANVHTHKNSKLYEIQRRAPLFMVSKEKLKISSWCIHNTKNCLKKITNEKVMASQSVHGQKVKKCHPTLRKCSENSQVKPLYVDLLPLEFQDEL
jgi:gamma-glutamyl-gamma-aminobutyrate hydrolase PuuD